MPSLPPSPDLSQASSKEIETGYPPVCIRALYTARRKASIVRSIPDPGGAVPAIPFGLSITV